MKKIELKMLLEEKNHQLKACYKLVVYMATLAFASFAVSALQLFLNNYSNGK